MQEVDLRRLQMVESSATLCKMQMQFCVFLSAILCKKYLPKTCL